MARNAASKDQVRAVKGREKRLRQRELDDVRAILLTPHGRRFWLRMLRRGGIFGESYSPLDEAAHQPYLTVWREGKRNMALSMLADMNEAAPETYQTMLQEDARNQEIAKVEEKEIEKKAATDDEGEEAEEGKPESP